MTVSIIYNAVINSENPPVHVIDNAYYKKLPVHVINNDKLLIISSTDPTHHMMLNRDLQALLQMYILKEEYQKHTMNMYQTPVESYRSHLIHLASARAIHFIFKH